jgi:HSP20 family protein
MKSFGLLASRDFVFIKPRQFNYIPATDVFETTDSITIVMDVPGIDLAKVRIEILGDLMTFLGPISSLNGDDDEIASEIPDGTYYRRFKLLDGIDRRKIAAHLKDGVLKIHLPKTKKEQVKLIPID